GDSAMAIIRRWLSTAGSLARAVTQLLSSGGRPMALLAALVALADALADVLAHVGVGDDVLHVVVVEHPELARAEGLGDGQRQLGLGLDDEGAHLEDARLHLLLHGHGGGAPRLGARLGYLLVGLGLLGLQLGADVGA